MAQRSITYNSEVTRFESIEQFLKFDGRLSGLIEISDSLPILVYFRNRDANVTFVPFAAALGVKRVRDLPFFGGMSTSAHLTSNTILISDPSLILSDRLGLGWYAGSNQQVDLQRKITLIIKKLAGDSRLVFFGASGGGYAALEQALQFENSTALVTNPQVDMRRSPSFKNYAKIAWDGLDEMTKEPPVIYEVLDAYSRQTSARVVYLQNYGDTIHVEKHWKPFIEAVHPSNQVLSLTPHIGEGHVSPDKETFKRLFSLLTTVEDWERLCTELESLPITRVVS